jgi:hypothetical protein
MITQKDGEIASLTKNLKESEENYKQLLMMLSKSEIGLPEAQESFWKPQPKPVPEEVKAPKID